MGKPMTMKDYFYQAFTINGLIESNRFEVERLRSLASSMSGSDLTKPLVKSQAQKGCLEDTVALIADLEANIVADINKCLRLKRQMRRIINAVENPKLKLVLQKRYIELKKWDEVAAEMKYNTRRVTQLHGQALAIAEKVAKNYALVFL